MMNKFNIEFSGIRNTFDYFRSGLPEADLDIYILLAMGLSAVILFVVLRFIPAVPGKPKRNSYIVLGVFFISLLILPLCHIAINAAIPISGLNSNVGNSLFVLTRDNPEFKCAFENTLAHYGPLEYEWQIRAAANEAFTFIYENPQDSNGQLHDKNAPAHHCSNIPI